MKSATRDDLTTALTLDGGWSLTSTERGNMERNESLSERVLPKHIQFHVKIALFSSFLNV